MGEGADEVSSEADTLELRADIERTRADMSATIDAIQEQLDPKHLAEQVREQVRHQFDEAKANVRDATIGKAEALMRDAGDTMTEARYTLMDTVRQNPIPAAMVGIGLGWLFMNRGSGRPRRSQQDFERYRSRTTYACDYPYYPSANAMYPADRERYEREGMMAQGQRRVGEGLHRAQDTAGDAMSRAQDAAGNAVNRVQDAAGSAVGRVQDAAGNVAHRVQDAAGNAVNTVQDAAGSAAHRVQDMTGTLASETAYQTQRAEDRLRQALRENPLGVGAIALALGTAVGLAIPETEREHQLMGEARDSLVERAQSAAQDTIEKVQQVASDVLQSAENTATEKARDVGLTGNERSVS
jgi:hypothetical protein